MPEATPNQLNTFLKAEEALGEHLVARILEVTWSEDNEDAFCWRLNDCSTCFRRLAEGEAGFVWGRPLGDDPHAQHITLEAYCSKECVQEALDQWAEKLGATALYAGWFTL